MRQRRLGRTGLRVSEISLGTVELGMDYGFHPSGRRRPTRAEAESLLGRALDLRVNLIDTARLYGDSETIIGRALAHRRSEYVLATKVPTFREQQLEPAALGRRLRASVEESLRALRTDVIDILMLHSASLEAVQSRAFADILDELRASGLCRYTGASVYGEAAALAAIESGRYDCLQIAYSALDRRPELRILPAARAADIGIVARSVLLKGALSYRLDALPAALSTLKAKVAELAATAGRGLGELPELAYRYVLGAEPPQTALVGASAVEELEQALRFAEAGPLPSALLARIRALEMLPEPELDPGNWPAA
jgi:aryl-alcohol dehydrogenase-like predicted oxidoreductase